MNDDGLQRHFQLAFSNYNQVYSSQRQSYIQKFIHPHEHSTSQKLTK